MGMAMKQGYALMEVLVSAALLSIALYCSLQVHQLAKQLDQNQENKIESLKNQIKVLDSLGVEQLKCESLKFSRDSVTWKIERVTPYIPLLKIYTETTPDFWRMKKCEI